MSVSAPPAAAHGGYATLADIHNRPGFDALADRCPELKGWIEKYGADGTPLPEKLSDPEVQSVFLKGGYPASSGEQSKRSDGKLAGAYEFLQGLHHARNSAMQPIELCPTAEQLQQLQQQQGQGQEASFRLMPLEDRDLKSVCGLFDTDEMPPTELEWDGKVCYRTASEHRVCMQHGLTAVWQHIYSL